MGLFAHLSVRIPLLSLTSNCNVRILQSFEELIGMTHTAKHWTSALNMGNISVCIDIFYKQYSITLLKNTMEEHLHPVYSLVNFIIVYLNGQKNRRVRY